MLQPRFRVVLASSSPRRRELLSTLFAGFEVEPSDVDEDFLTQEDPWQTARDLARAKAEAIAKRHSDALVIGSDTVVAYLEAHSSWMQLAKPVNESDALRMLQLLSGKRHAVITAVAALSPFGQIEFEETTWVTFRTLQQSEVESYVATGEPLDKAGAYGIQGGAACFVKSMEGHLSTVVGLPIERLHQELIFSRLANEL